MTAVNGAPALDQETSPVDRSGSEGFAFSLLGLEHGIAANLANPIAQQPLQKSLRLA